MSRLAGKDKTFARNGNSLMAARSNSASTLAKTVLMVVCPFANLGRDCALSFTRRQFLKSDGLNKNERPGALFGVTAETLLGCSGKSNCSMVRAWNFNSFPSGTLRVHGPGSGAEQYQGDADAAQQDAQPRIMIM